MCHMCSETKKDHEILYRKGKVKLILKEMRIHNLNYTNNALRVMMGKSEQNYVCFFE